MRSTGIRMVCRLLIVSLVLLQSPLGQAGMVGADQVVSAASAQAERSTMVGLLGRADVASQLQSMGVDAKLAQDRVAALTDEEVRTLAGNLNSLPAGAISSGLGWALLIAIAVIVYLNWK